MWSEWIQPPDRDQPPFRRMVSGPGFLLPELVGTLDDVEVFVGSGRDWVGAQFRTAPPDLNPFPNPLATLTEGVDYEAKPGSDPGDPYRFVEYEGGIYAPDAHTIQKWVWPAFSYPYGGPYIDHKDGTPGSGVASIVAPTDYDDVDSDLGAPGLQAGGIPSKPVGTPFAAFTGSEADGTELADPPVVGPFEAFTVVFEFDEPSVGDDRVYFTIPRNPTAQYRPPRFRYWVPGGAPLRLIQRGDGLGMGSGRLFGSGTRQSSTRVLGAL